MLFRTPLNYTQGIVQYDTSVVACAITDDTVIVSDAPPAGIHQLLLHNQSQYTYIYHLPAHLLPLSSHLLTHSRFTRNNASLTL